MSIFLPISFRKLLIILLVTAGFGETYATPLVSNLAVTTRYVRAGGTGDGSSWANASGNLQAMINASTSGQQVWVAAGTYKPTTGTDRSVSFSMKNGVSMYGGFASSGTPGMTDRNPASYTTILSGDIGVANTTSDNSYHVIQSSGLDRSTVLDGFVIRDGNADVLGGGMSNQNSSPSLINCTFINNSAISGGGMFNNSSSPSLTNCSFVNNTASEQSGGMYNYDSSTPMLTNCLFSGNVAGENAGGLYSDNHSNPSLINCLFTDNRAASGGGVCAYINSNVNLINCSFRNNTATDGGAVSTIISSSATLTNCIVFTNGGQKTFTGNNIVANYSLFDSGVTGYTSGGNNKITDVSPFASATSTQLNACAQAINAGNNAVNTTTLDLAANTRVAGGTIDMGAYEFQGASNVTVFTQQPVSASGCVGSTVTIPVSVSGGGPFTIQLYRNAAAVGSPQSTSAATLTFNNLQMSDAGSYQVVATGTCNSLTSSAFSLTVNPLPVVSITPSATAICVGQTASLVASGADTYRWSTGQTTASISVTASGSYSVTGISGAGCVATAITSVSVNPLPTPTIDALASSYCSGDGSVSLSGLPVGGVFTIDGLPLTTLNPASLSIGQHTVVYSYTNTNGCANTTSQTVTINQTPTAPTLLTLSGQPYAGGVSSLTVSQNTGIVSLGVSGCSGGTISWNGGNSTTLAVSTSQLGIQSFTALCTQGGCSSPTATATVTVVPTTLGVLYRDADFGNTANNIIKPYLQLSNAGNEAIPYSEITVRYWLTPEGTAPTSFPIYYAPLGSIAVRYVALSQPRQGALGYVEYSFPGGGNLPAQGNSGVIENGIQKPDGSNFNDLDDYSYQANYTDYLANPHITAYRTGANGVPVLFWGQEPAMVSSQAAVTVYSATKDSPTASQIQTRVELRNEGNVALPVSALKLRYYFTSDNGQLANVNVDYADMGASNVQAQVVKLTQPVNGADSYVELSFPGNSMQLNAQSSLGVIDFRIVRSDYGLLDQTNDYSFAPNYGNLGLNNHILAYLSNSLVFGTPPSGVPARVAVLEPTTRLQARLLGNPVIGSHAELEITGIEGQAVSLRLVDLQGRAIVEQRIEQARQSERVSLPLGSSRGQLLLNVNTATQQQSLKLIRP